MIQASPPIACTGRTSKYKYFGVTPTYLGRAEAEQVTLQVAFWDVQREPQLRQRQGSGAWM